MSTVLPFPRPSATTFPSASSEWTTPQPLFDSLDKIFHFETDVCATAANAKCARFYTAEDDGLAQEWRGVCWCNPPYGKGLGRWIEKACESRATVVMLVPAYTANAWWHRYVIPHAEVILLRGRLQFGGVPFPAPFSSAVVVFNRDTKGAKRHLKRCAGCNDFFFAARSDAIRCGGRCRMAQSRAIREASERMRIAS